MKLYDAATAPNPRRVRIFLAEKGIQVPVVPVDLAGKEQFSPAYRAINPCCMVPTLVLDDGTAIGEVLAIWRYLEEVHPEPPLMGRTAKDKALVTMWERRMELDGYLAAAEAVRNSLLRLAGRALVGPRDYPQIPALGERGKARVLDFYDDLDSRLADNPFVAGDAFSVADITAIVTIDFVASRLDLPVPSGHGALRRWYDTVAARPSMKA